MVNIKEIRSIASSIATHLGELDANNDTKIARSELLSPESLRILKDDCEFKIAGTAFKKISVNGGAADIESMRRALADAVKSCRAER